MSWYKTGTITVNNGSAAITGSGTAWVANAAAGEAIYLPDGKFYEINSVNSDTSITLAGNYTGTSLSGQSYTILPSQSFIRDLAAQAAALINSYASIANTAGAGKFGDGTLGAPGISFVSDTNTGIRRTADGTFRLVSNGVDIAEIGPNGMTLLSPDGMKSLAVTNSGATITGPLAVATASKTGFTVGSGTGADAGLYVGTRGDGYGALWSMKVTPSATNHAFMADGVTSAINGSTYSALQVGNTAMVLASSTSVALTGAVLVGASSAGGNKVNIQSDAAHLRLQAATNTNRNLSLSYNYSGDYGQINCDESGANQKDLWITGLNLKFGRNTSAATMALSASGDLLVGATNPLGSEQAYILSSSAGKDVLLVNNTASSGTGERLIRGRANGSDTFYVYTNGNVVNTNNSYGAISDLKLKQDIVDAKSQWADIKALAVRKYRLKVAPTGPLMMGLIAQEAEAVSPGLVEATDDYEEVVVEPARTEVKIVQRQKTQKLSVEQPTPTLVDGRYLLRMVPTEIDAPLIEEHPLFAEDGSPIMEIVEPEQLAVTDADGNVVTPAKPAVLRQAVHRVPVMEDVEETVEIPAKTERRPTGTQTKSVKYSILYMKAVKALQEAMERIETLEAEVAAIKGV